jgi:hypothetical protein
MLLNMPFYYSRLHPTVQCAPPILLRLHGHRPRNVDELPPSLNYSLYYNLFANGQNEHVAQDMIEHIQPQLLSSQYSQMSCGPIPSLWNTNASTRCVLPQQPATYTAIVLPEHLSLLFSHRFMQPPVLNILGDILAVQAREN